MKNIFRKDLNLNDKWWHRLFKIIFVVILIILLVKVFLYHLNESNKHYKLVDTLENRLNDKAVKISDLLEYGEIFDRPGRGGYKEYGNFGKSDLYCSNKLYTIENIKYIIKETGINNFDRFIYLKNKTNIEEFSKNIKENNIKCIIKDNAEIDFLNSIDWFNEYGFYKKNNLSYFLDSYYGLKFIINILATFLIYIVLFYIIYYKIILYIIFGNNNNKT